VLSVVRTSAKRRRPQRPEFADTTVWGVASFVSRLSIGCAKVAATSLRRCTRGGVIIINSPLNLEHMPYRSHTHQWPGKIYQPLGVWLNPVLLHLSHVLSPHCAHHSWGVVIGPTSHLCWVSVHRFY